MNSFDRIFGAGPRIHLTLLSLSVIIYFLRTSDSIFSLGFDGAQLTLALILAIAWGVIALWSLASLGRKIGLTVLQSGPYAFVRHPMYVAEIFFGFCIVAVTLDTWLAFIGMAIAFMLAPAFVAYEEKIMETQFGDDWRAYASTTPQFFPTRKNKHTQTSSDTLV